MKFHRLLTFMMLGALPALAAAQTTSPQIWRCGSSYSTVPCTQGGRTLEAVEPRPDADVQAAQQQAERDKRTAAQMRQDRLREEAAAARSTAVALGPQQRELVPVAVTAKKARAKPPRPPKHRLQRPEDADTYRAVDPSSRRTKG